MLKDVLSKNLNVVFCGTAKGKASATLGFYYAGPNNKFYHILYKAGFTPHMLSPSECYDINQYKIGLTDLVHVECGNDNEINKENYEVEGFIKKMEQLTPKFIAFTSKKAASFALGFCGVTSLVEYGLQQKKVGSSFVFVLPSTSGSARKFWNESYWVQLNAKIKSI
jgi:TDG/mug DNA glycosylase family protein